MKSSIQTIPSYLAQRYHGWKTTEFAENSSWFAHLANHGQNPRIMVISCCDSRLQVTKIFGADSGDIFLHRNIANLVPPHTADGGLHGTSAAVEYGVNHLMVTNLLVIGHSQCGGIAGAYDICHHEDDAIGDESEFLRPWLELMKPGYERITVNPDDRNDDLRQMEKQSVLVSLENLLGFPFVKSAVNEGRLTLHGLWHNIGEGQLEQYNPETDQFEQV